MTADLRTLGAGLGRPIEPGNPWAQPNDKAFAAMDAVLAAVLPAHRRQVLDEAVDAIEREPFDLKVNDGTTATGGYLRPQTATDAVRRLAETAPPARCGGAESLQDGSVVPVATPNPSTAVSAGGAEPLDESPWLADGTTAQAPGRHIYRVGHESPIGSMDTPALAAQVVAEHRHAVEFRALVAPEDPGPTRRPDDAGTLAVRLAQLRDEAHPDPGEFIAVSRREWAALLRERTQVEHTIEGLADAALRLSGAWELAAERGRFALEVTAERDRLRAAVERVLALHSPRVGWEREWKDPDEALAAGWPPCAGCWIEGVGYREIGKCPTRAALAEPCTVAPTSKSAPKSDAAE